MSRVSKGWNWFALKSFTSPAGSGMRARPITPGKNINFFVAKWPDSTIDKMIDADLIAEIEEGADVDKALEILNAESNANLAAKKAEEAKLVAAKVAESSKAFKPVKVGKA